MNTTNNRKPARTRTTEAYREAGIEPTIAEMLSEPIVRTLMAHDSVSEEMLIDVIDRARARTFEAA
jgi:hypothetical protein